MNMEIGLWNKRDRHYDDDYDVGYDDVEGKHGNRAKLNGVEIRSPKH